MEAQLKKADRLAAIGELSSRIAHEIRNPLASISGSVQLISQGTNVAHKDHVLMDILLRETDRLNELIKDFLAYARPNPPIKIRIFLRQFLSELSLLLLCDERFKSTTIHNGCHEDLIVEADRDQLQQVFWNLLVNAAEAMASGGTIRVDAEVMCDEDIGVFIGDVVKISISDSGKGMSKEDTARIFEPFFTTKPQGTGLGLATVYRIIESHNGFIYVESALHKGTTFTMCLPQSGLQLDKG